MNRKKNLKKKRKGKDQLYFTFLLNNKTNAYKRQPIALRIVLGLQVELLIVSRESGGVRHGHILQKWEEMLVSSVLGLISTTATAISLPKKWS